MTKEFYVEEPAVVETSPSDPLFLFELAVEIEKGLKKIAINTAGLEALVRPETIEVRVINRYHRGVSEMGVHIQTRVFKGSAKQ